MERFTSAVCSRLTDSKKCVDGTPSLILRKSSELFAICSQDVQGCLNVFLIYLKSGACHFKYELRFCKCGILKNAV